MYSSLVSYRTRNAYYHASSWVIHHASSFASTILRRNLRTLILLSFSLFLDPSVQPPDPVFFLKIFTPGVFKTPTQFLITPTGVIPNTDPSFSRGFNTTDPVLLTPTGGFFKVPTRLFSRGFFLLPICFLALRNSGVFARLISFSYISSANYWLFISL